MDIAQKIDYKGIIWLVLGVALAALLVQLDMVSNFLLSFNQLGYLGAFLAGLLYAFSFTAAIGVLLIVNMAVEMPLLAVSIVAALGTVLGDYLIFSFIRDTFFKQIKYEYEEVKEEVKAVLHPNRYVRWLLIALGLIIIASPIPDEIGVSLLGLSRIKKPYFIGLTYILNFIGIFLLLSIASKIAG